MIGEGAIEPVVGDVTVSETVADLANDADVLVIAVGGPDQGVTFGPPRPANVRARTEPAAIQRSGMPMVERVITYHDFAVAIVDEIERPRHPNARFTAGY